MSTAVRVASVRLPEDVYVMSSLIAKRRHLSFNSLVRDALLEVMAKERYREMYEAATILGSDPDECDVEFAFHAQSEVALRDE